MDVKKLMTGANPQSIMLEQTRGLKAKWEKTGLLEGVKSETQKHGMAVILENQAKQLLDEATRTGTSAGSEEWAGVALPLVRRIFGSIAAKEFVSVQPMNLPSGLIFYMDFKYGSTVGKDINRPASGSSLYGATGSFGLDNLDSSAGKLGSTQAANGGLYGAGRFGYTINDLTTAKDATLASASLASINFDLSDSTVSASYAAGKLRTLTVSLPTDSDYNAVRAFDFYQSGSGYIQYPQYTYKNGSNVVFLAEITNSSWSGSTIVGGTLKYLAQPLDYNRGDFEDKGSDLPITEIELELKSEPIVAKTRKLKAIWTPELAQDLNAYHSIDAEAELTQMLSEYISLEIDLEILEMLQQNALTTEYWSAKVGYEWDGVGFAIDSNAAAASAYQKNTWFQTLGIKLQKVSNKIHQLTMRGGANFIVVSPNVATILESMNGFSANPGKDALQFAAGVTNIGSISNRYDVYKNPYMTENVILLGFKGSNFFETGAVYAPYVPLIMTPLVYDPTNFTPRRGVMTRYAKKIVRPEFYGKIVVGGLESL
jgi:Major capsid protein Gp23